MENSSGARRAIASYIKEIRILRETLGPEDPRITPYFRDIAYTLQSLRKTKWAITAMERAVTMLEAQEKACPNAMSTYRWFQSAGTFFFSVNQFDKAYFLYKKVLNFQQKVYGPDTYVNAQILNKVGSTLLRLKNYSEAQIYLEMALRIREQWDMHDIGVTLSELGRALMSLKNYFGASTFLKRSLAYEISDKEKKINFRLLQETCIALQIPVLPDGCLPLMIEASIKEEPDILSDYVLSVEQRLSIVAEVNKINKKVQQSSY